MLYLILIYKIPKKERTCLSIIVKLFGRAFQIYDDVVNLVEKNFGNMKNGLGGDITEGKISFPIVYCLSKFRNRKISFENSINSENIQKDQSCSENVGKNKSMKKSKQRTQDNSFKSEYSISNYLYLYINNFIFC